MWVASTFSQGQWKAGVGVNSSFAPFPWVHWSTCTYFVQGSNQSGTIALSGYVLLCPCPMVLGPTSSLLSHPPVAELAVSASVFGLTFAPCVTYMKITRVSFPLQSWLLYFCFIFFFDHSVRSLRILDNTVATISWLLQKPINDLKGTADRIHLDVLVSAIYGCSHPFQAGGSYIHSSGTDLPRLRLFIKTFTDPQAVPVPFSSPSEYVFPSLANFRIDTLPISSLGQSYRTSLFLLIHCQVNGQMCLLHFSSLFQSCT